MLLEDVLKIGAAIVASLGGASILVIAASSWLAKVWANRILENEKGQIQKEIESIKANNQIYLDALSNSSLLYVESQKVVSIERTAAIKSLWLSFLVVKKSQPTILFFLDLLPFSEYRQIHTNKKMSEFDESISIQGMTKILDGDAQNVRPFIDETAFMYFWLYRALVGRLSNYVREIRENGAPKEAWQRSNEVLDILHPVLDEETVNRIQTEMWSTRELFEHIELLLVEHLRELASGKAESSSSVRHLAELSKATSVLRRGNPVELPS
ncbi:hypothetical protein ACWM6O_004319 [Vibrio vulnificus]